MWFCRQNLKYVFEHGIILENILLQQENGTVKTVVTYLKTPSALLAILILLLCVVLMNCCKWRNCVLWRGLCFVPLLLCIIHLASYNFGKQWMFGLKWFWPMYLAALLMVLWQFTGGRIVLHQITVGAILVLSIFNFIYIPMVIPLALHTYTTQNWTDSFVKTVHTIEKEYPISDWKGIDYDALLEEFLPRIQEAERKNDETELGVVLNDFTNRFYDGHVSLQPANSDIAIRVNNQLMGNDYGLSLISMDNGNVVAVCVEPEGEAAKQGIRTGTVITHWNGVPVQEAKYSYMLPIRSPVAENEKPTKTMLLAGQGGETVSVTFIADDGQSKTVTLHRMGEYMTRFRKAYGQFAHQVEKDENFSYKMISDTCGYLRIHSEEINPFETIYVTFAGKAPFIEKRVDEILTELQAQGMKTLIIDIRNNTGGSPYVSAAIASLFTDDTYTHSWSTLDYGSDEGTPRGEPLIVYGNGKWKTLPVVVLSNQNTVSAGDAMADMLSRLPNVTLMGMTPSNGSFQATGGMVFLAEGYFGIYYPVWLDASEDGNPVIDTDTTRQTRIPLEVEIPVDEAAIKTIYAEDGQDYELEYALQWLLNQK